jgi:metal-responsive CopG/Arc/MetJ family transcriptional regulator
MDLYGGQMTTITISLTKEIKRGLGEVTRETGLSRDDIIRQALREFLLVRRFRALRARMIPHAQAQGIFSDEDVFEIEST